MRLFVVSNIIYICKYQKYKKVFQTKIILKSHIKVYIVMINI